ncbi:hypothetical protein KC19_VG215200 [Ceratodon purpureus]|uniref:Uncharacterized protein n=1 Tax=Ceratodon purpureus TaxID=3225 RepID=A0A8T0HSB7_CERPU|nr:hypothetical protein KC19_VG215200 [Ceratodon purpureus]
MCGLFLYNAILLTHVCAPHIYAGGSTMGLHNYLPKCETPTAKSRAQETLIV